MIKILYICLALLGGIMSGIQAPINGALAKKTGSLEGAFISFFIGMLLLTLIFLFFGRGSILQVFSLPKWQLLGGVVGAIFVTSMIIAVPKIGVASAIFAAILGQLLISLIIDHYGFFGVTKITFDWNRAIGLMFMIVALFFIFRGNLTS